MRRALFFIVAIFYAATSFASIPRVSVLDGASIARASMLDAAPPIADTLSETRIRVSDVLAPFEHPAQSELTRALHQAYADVSTTNASGLAGFLSVDPSPKQRLQQPQSWNRYAYSMNNPLRYVDPDGRDAADFRVIRVPVNVVYSNADKVIANDGRTLRQVTERGISYSRNFMARAGIALDIRRHEARLNVETVLRVDGPVSTSNGEVSLRQFASATPGATMVVSGDLANGGVTP